MRVNDSAEGVIDRLAGKYLWLNVSRFDERQRRQRVVLPKAAGCWDYAPLIDLVVREPGIDGHRFLGQTVAGRVAHLQRTNDPSLAHFMAWYERVITPHLAVLERRRRVPDNLYCVDVASLPFVSPLAAMVEAVGSSRATAEQWSASLLTMTEKGIKQEELILSGVLTRLARHSDGEKLTRPQVLRLIDLSHAIPKLVNESRHAFTARAGWRECCDRIPTKEFGRRRLRQVGEGMVHIRFRHRSLGWAVARARFGDLFADQWGWWIVLDERGRLVEAVRSGFDSVDDAIAFAESQISTRYASWGKDQLAARWERFSLPGGDDYRELLLQLDDWPENYQPRHYRTRNVLVHMRTSLRRSTDGRRVLFLDEVQSDWHADVHQRTKTGAVRGDERAVAQAPYAKEWPLLAMKVMLWWAQRCGAEGLAWSNAELQQQRWQGYGPPDLLYRKLLPVAGAAIAKALTLRFDTTRLHIRSGSRVVDLTKGSWVVRGRNGHVLTKPFQTRAQAEAFANLTGEITVLDVPVLWLDTKRLLTSIPLFGAGSMASWTR